MRERERERIAGSDEGGGDVMRLPLHACNFM